MNGLGGRPILSPTDSLGIRGLEKRGWRSEPRLRGFAPSARSGPTGSQAPRSPCGGGADSRPPVAAAVGPAMKSSRWALRVWAASTDSARQGPRFGEVTAVRSSQEFRPRRPIDSIGARFRSGWGRLTHEEQTP